MTIKFGKFANFIVRNFVVIWEAPILETTEPLQVQEPLKGRNVLLRGVASLVVHVRSSSRQEEGSKQPEKVTKQPEKARQQQLPEKEKARQQPLLPEKEKARQQPLLPEKRKARQQPLLPEKDKAEHLAH